MSDDTIEFILWLMLFFAALLGSAFFGTISGAITGWLVGLTPLGTAVMKVWFSLTHVKCELWELGAFMGFISGFIEGVVTVKERDES